MKRRRRRPLPRRRRPPRRWHRKTPEEAAAALEWTGCESKEKPRERAFCYLKSESEASLEPLFVLGRDLAEKAVSHPVSYWPDFTYAAENAGVIAAKTHETRLYAGLQATSEVDQLFAVEAIHHMLSTLRFGYAHGKSVDEGTRKDRLAAAHTGCLSKLTGKDARLVKAAADCLKEIHDPTDTAALVDVAVSHPSLEVQTHLLGLVGGFGPLPAASLPKLVPLLEKPMPTKWTHEEVALRATICRIFLREVDPKAAWTKKPAEAAVREIGNRDSQAKAPCEELARRP